MKKLQVLFFLVILIAAGSYLFYREGTLPVNKNDKSSILFTVKPGERPDTVINNLFNQDLIRSKTIFYIIVKEMGIDKKIQAGQFELSKSMTAEEVAKNLTHGTLDVRVTLIEGMRKEEMAQIISKSLDIPEVEFSQLVAEGYVFPDTYDFPRNADANAVMTIIDNNFKSKFDADLHARAKAKNLTEKEVLILASLVEREARQSSTRQKVASIILKRYLDDMPLQIDATVQYALGYQIGEKTWWKNDLTIDDLKINSPYNTYINRGLPPGPICNPSLSSIEAVINADPNTPYLYYITDKNGVMHYATTLEEHQANISKYLQ